MFELKEKPVKRKLSLKYGKTLPLLPSNVESQNFSLKLSAFIQKTLV